MTCKIIHNMHVMHANMDAIVLWMLVLASVTCEFGPNLHVGTAGIDVGVILHVLVASGHTWH